MSERSFDRSGQALHRVSQLYSAPEFVKTASDEEVYGNKQDLQPNLYADVLNKNFPCHTPAATWAQYGFFLDKKSSYDKETASKIEQRFQTFAHFHDVADELDKIRKVAASNEPISEDSLPDTTFAIVANTPKGKIRQCPMRNSLETIKAAEILDKHYDRFTYELRRTAAERILQKAAEYGADLNNDLGRFIEKQAGRGLCSAAEVAELLMDRVAASAHCRKNNDQSQADMLKMAKLCIEKPSQVRDIDTLAKIAGVVDAFDKVWELTSNNRGGLPRLEYVLFGVSTDDMHKVAAEHCCMTTGSIYKLADFEKLSLSDIRDSFGNSLVEEVSGDGIHLDFEKLATIAPTMPRDEAEIFDQLMADKGIAPFAKEASQTPRGVPAEYFAHMASSYKSSIYDGSRLKKKKGDSLFDLFE